MNLLPLPDGLRNFLIKEKALAPGVIAAGSYGIVEKELPTCSVKSGIIVSKNVPSETVYKLVKAWSENSDRVRAIHKSVAQWDPRNAWEDAGGPLHPGAEKYFKEKGYIK